MPRRLAFTRLTLREQPLVYFATAFVCGEIAASQFQISNLKFWFGFAFFLFLMAFILIFKSARSAIITPILLMNCAICGGLLWSLNEAGIGDHRIKKLFEQKIIQADEPVEIWGVIKAAPELAPDRIYLEVAVECLAAFKKEHVASGVVHLVVPVNEVQDRADYDALKLNYGTRLRALTNLRKSAGYRNPGAPDFDEMLEYRGYDATGLIKSPLLIERLDEGPRYRTLSFLYAIRANAIAIILRSFRQPTSGVLAAALFGNQYFLSKETADIFREGGTFHLLIISGLHVAMLALIIDRLISKATKSRGLRFFIIVSLLWAYALMVGAQPAITRSTVMLTIVLIGQLIFRTAPGANILAASALVLLAWQPRDLFNPSFQLSFLTVLMIVMIAAPLLDRIKKIGEWQPSTLTPYPPRASRWLKWSAEILHWNEQEFREEMRRSPIHYRLEKSHVACWLSETKFKRFFQQIFRWTFTTIISTIVVQVGLLPLMIAYFHRVSFVSPLTNAIQAALMFILMIAGALYLLAHFVFAWLAMKIAFLIDAIGWLSVHATDWLLIYRKLNFRVPDYGANSGKIYFGYFCFVLILMIALNRWNPFALEKGKMEEGTRERSREGEMEGRRDAEMQRCREREIRGEKRSFPLSLFPSFPPDLRLCLPLSFLPPFPFSFFLSLSGGALILLFVLLVWHPFQHRYEAGRLSVTFLDVGQGDSLLISFPNGKLMLLDAGGRIPVDLERRDGEEIFIEDHISVGEAAVAPALWRRGIKHLDYIAASHAHSDHTGGFADIGQSFTIESAVTGAIPNRDLQFEAFRQAAIRNYAPLKSWTRGNRIDIDGVTIETLAPVVEMSTAPASVNNQSLVLRLRYGNRVFLLMGDIEKEVEARLITENENLKTDVLKVAHHGSRSSTTEEFLARAQPQYAVISVAHPSPFDHPHGEVLARLNQIGARIFQTSQCGAITISSDGNDLRVETFVKCE